MSRLAIITSSPPDVEGGHLVIARALVRAAQDAGHHASLLVTPDYGFGRNLSTYWSNWRTVPGPVDQVISLRYPSYAVRHPVHVCWLNHTIREYYDLWPTFSATLSLPNRLKEQVRRTLLHGMDAWLLKRNLTRLVAQSATIGRRIRADFGIQTEVVHPPPPHRPYRCEEYGPYIFAVSRLVPLKRVDLLLRALAEPIARGVTAVIAGDGESRRDLHTLAATLGVDRRVSFLGRIDESAMLEHLARCRAVCFAPFDEDYGFVTAEAFASGKAVITCRDSGGPTELVTHEVSGLIANPTPSALAAAIVRLSEDRGLAERLGKNASARALAMSWADVVSRLVIVK